MRQQRLPHYECDPPPIPIETSSTKPLQVAGLFAGIGGVEAGFSIAGHHSKLLCEIDDAASAVLRAHFPGTEIVADIRDIACLPDMGLLAAGFPCQDLSISGPRGGISGQRSSLVQHVFRLLDTTATGPRWLLLENVPFMLELQKGEGMRYLLNEIERRGYFWAYRVVDTRAFGLPHRRHRLLLLASRTCDPVPPLLGCDTNGPALAPFNRDAACGFYWTEGHRGIGWSVNCVPPIKVGSGLGIPSAPAVWDPRDGSIFQPHINDLERLQGFGPGWTIPAETVATPSARWRLVGNSVSVPLAAWLGRRLLATTQYDRSRDWPIPERGAWPQAAWGCAGRRYESCVSMYPVSEQLPPLTDFLTYERQPMSARAAAGLLNRLTKYGAIVPDRFRADLKKLAETYTSPVSIVPEGVPH
jgi:DNA (cytosine-5)-methyltransferase 1